MRDSEQRRLIAKVPLSRALLLSYLALMLLASFHVYKEHDDEADPGGNNERYANSGN